MNVMYVDKGIFNVIDDASALHLQYCLFLCPEACESNVWRFGCPDMCLFFFVHSMRHQIGFGGANMLNINAYRYFAYCYSDSVLAMGDRETWAILQIGLSVLVVEEDGGRV